MSKQFHHNTWYRKVAGTESCINTAKKRSLTLSLDLVHSQKSSTGKLVGPMLVDGAHDTCPRLSKKNTSAEWVQYRSIHLLRQQAKTENNVPKTNRPLY